VTAERGACSVCGAERRLKIDGTMPGHPRKGAEPAWCSGSQKLPRARNVRSDSMEDVVKSVTLPNEERSYLRDLVQRDIVRANLVLQLIPDESHESHVQALRIKRFATDVLGRL
jgi:hypothetical protein